VTRHRTTRARHLRPAPLAEGESILDLADQEVERRGQFVAQLFEYLSAKLRAFVGAGCPLDEQEALQWQIMNALELSDATFRGAEDWQERHRDAVREAIAERQAALQGDQPPSLLMAAFWCDAALLAEEEFWALIRTHRSSLRAADLKAAQSRRSRAH